MKAIVAACLICLASMPLLSSAEDVPPLSSIWMGMMKNDQFLVFYGKPTVINNNPYVGTLWHKVVFTQLHASDKGRYKTEMLLIELECTARKAALIRNVRFAESGTKISDTLVESAQLQFFDFTDKTKRTADNALIFDIAKIDYEATCVKGD